MDTFAVNTIRPPKIPEKGHLLRVVPDNQQIAWNDTAVDLPRSTLPALLRQAADTSPDVVAVRDSTGSLTYLELVERVHQFAHHLDELGARRGTRIACALPRGIDAVVAQAAVFAVGAIYVPVDSSTPAAGDIVVGPAEIRDPRIADQPAVPLDHDPGFEDIAYLIHSSGGPVAVSHGAIAHSTLARLHRYGVAVRRFALISALTSDASLAGIWWTLASGGELVLLSPDTSTAVVELTAAVSSGGVSHTLLTPSLHHALLSAVDEVAPGMRQVIVTGASCPASLVSSHYRLLPEVSLVQEYGPVEAAGWCTSATLSPGAPVAVGTPIANASVWVLAGDRLAEAGEVGEVCVGGAGLAFGYLGAPGLTAARFGPHPVDAGRVVFRTGDLGRWRLDGQLEVLG
ncbi:hypothetical protein Lesp02_07760 [Lentzea sp. NBRC 105346]|uniref:AMP-binding protein n=1 Tax=Lentzea sp. NBRC 105346 TaxID=3032205 RepID=UPI0024A5F5E5|nr:AMP-binding protein [Lentzea sp. NBRC 105346]GLZ28586.1 hypothetical protein Lesp02_07760 [Lentzea sp. NBRC 105346]